MIISLLDGVEQVANSVDKNLKQKSEHLINGNFKAIGKQVLIPPNTK